MVSKEASTKHDVRLLQKSLFEIYFSLTSKESEICFKLFCIQNVSLSCQLKSSFEN